MCISNVIVKYYYYYYSYIIQYGPVLLNAKAGRRRNVGITSSNILRTSIVNWNISYVVYWISLEMLSTVVVLYLTYVTCCGHVLTFVRAIYIKCSRGV